MNDIEKLIKEYSSKKLKEIIEQQSSSYSESFIDYAKDELIRRGETFQFNEDIEKEVAAMKDDDLKNLVEKEWNNFHLEYLEIARKEYLKRGFKNTTNEVIQARENKVEKKYPVLRSIIEIYHVFAWIYGILAVGFAVYCFTGKSEFGGLMIAIPTLIIGSVIVLSLLATSETIKLFIDMEENTRRTQEKLDMK